MYAQGRGWGDRYEHMWPTCTHAKSLTGVCDSYVEVKVRLVNCDGHTRTANKVLYHPLSSTEIQYFFRICRVRHTQLTRISTLCVREKVIKLKPNSLLYC